MTTVPVLAVGAFEYRHPGHQRDLDEQRSAETRPASRPIDVPPAVRPPSSYRPPWPAHIVTTTSTLDAMAGPTRSRHHDRARLPTADHAGDQYE